MSWKWRPKWAVKGICGFHGRSAKGLLLNVSSKLGVHQFPSFHSIFHILSSLVYYKNGSIRCVGLHFSNRTLDQLTPLFGPVFWGFFDWPQTVLCVPNFFAVQSGYRWFLNEHSCFHLPIFSTKHSANKTKYGLSIKDGQKISAMKTVLFLLSSRQNVN